MRTRLSSRFGMRRALALLAVAAATIVALAGPATTLGHPLGNFTINHYAGIRVSLAEILLDVVVDYAEIPAFQERRQLDVDGDGDVSATEATASREARCVDLAAFLALSVDGDPLELELFAAGLGFPPGVGGLETMRLVCQYRADLGREPRGVTVAFADASYAERIGWREIVVRGDGVTLAAQPGADELRTAETSARLTAYPEDLLAQPLDDRQVSFTAAPGGEALGPFVAPDAVSLGGPPLPGPSDDPPGTVPGGIGAEVPEIFRATDLTPIVALASILLAAGLGAGHALTPGHGKTLMAAYLVGTRGTVVHAMGLGLSVTVSHTLGILVLALLVTGAQSALPPDVVVRTVPILAALGFVAIGGWMVISELRRRRVAPPHVHDHEPHEHEPFELEHSHGGVRHRHAPPGRGTITWRSLFALGLAGGIIPSTSALIILLGALVAGRAAFGVVLVIAFGLGMALVLGGIGVALVLVRGRLERRPQASRFSRVAAQAPLVASVLVLGIGLWLTAQAVTALPTL